MTRQNEPLRSMLSANGSLLAFQSGNPQMFVAEMFYDSEPDAMAFGPLSQLGRVPHPFPQHSPRGDSRLSGKEAEATRETSSVTPAEAGVQSP